MSVPQLQWNRETHRLATGRLQNTLQATCSTIMDRTDQHLGTQALLTTADQWWTQREVTLKHERKICSQNFALLKFRVLVHFLPDLHSSRSQTPSRHSLQPRLPPVLTSLTLSSALVSTKSSKASHQVGPSVTGPAGRLWQTPAISSTVCPLLCCSPSRYPGS